ALVAPTGSSSATVPVDTKASALTPTRFAFGTSGFGTRVKGGQLPAGSDTTAFQTIGCTNSAGVERENHEAEADLGALNVSGVKSRVWTEKKGGVVSSYSRHSVANIVLGNASAGHLEISAVSSLARAYHNATGFHSKTTTHIASIVFTPSGGDAQGLEIPTPNHPITVPGLAKISLGSSIKRTRPTSAYAAADAIDIRVIPTDSRVQVAHSHAELAGGVAYGIFDGYSAGTRVDAVDNHVSSGPTPLSLMPCQGTNGEVRKKGAAHLNLADQIVVRGVDTEQYARNSAGAAEIREEGSIARINLGNGKLIVTGIVARAHAVLTPSGLKTDAKGTTIAEILVNGKRHTFPDSGVIEIPGLVRIEDSVIKRQRRGISVIALQLKLLDGTAATVNLGMARATVHRSGL
ncbi:choice-of-anchor P family protein, partial [Nocardioides sp.]|uniref:choice-of-anchor P family protein n=1 Tax=Nocardioides sp. TaxID=35761 RepID=UPI0031FE68BF|nr:hypothetical protein [Nocardioides sp.]